MEIVVVEDTKNKLVADLPGLDHTFCNNLKKELYADSVVKEATYRIEHPLIGTPRLLVHTDGKKAPRAAVKDALKRIKDQNKDFKSAFSKLK
jgi:DNA-directed RNA polymerase subunit L